MGVNDLSKVMLLLNHWVCSHIKFCRIMKLFSYCIMFSEVYAYRKSGLIWRWDSLPHFTDGRIQIQQGWVFSPLSISIIFVLCYTSTYPHCTSKCLSFARRHHHKLLLATLPPPMHTQTVKQCAGNTWLSGLGVGWSEPWFLTPIHIINTPTKIDFKLLMWQHLNTELWRGGNNRFV